MEDEEKPFLEHLDDLRKMLMRIMLTLLVSVTLCFVFNAWFFKVVQYPMARAGLASAEERNLPEGIPMEQWMLIHNAARGASVLEGPVRELFLTKAVPDAKLRSYTEALLLYHAADLLPLAQQTNYLEEAAKLLPTPLQAGVREASTAIQKTRPESSLEKMRPVIETEAFAPAETFMLSMKLSTFAGVIVSFPLLFYFLLEFILPGLNPRERKMLWPALAIGFGLFLMGVFFAYYFVIPNALEFFHEYSRDLGIRDGWRIGNYISFVVSFCLIFGVSFELPVVVMVLVKLGLLGSATMRRTRSWAIIIITTAGAILTPTGDIFTLSLLAGPMIVMYEICIWLAVAHEKKEAKLEAEEGSRDMARRAALFGIASVATAKPGSLPSDDGNERPTGDSPDPASDPDPDAAPAHHSSDPYHQDEHWHGHPHHAESDAATDDEEQAQYLREHAHLYPATETHPEAAPTVEPTPETSAAPKAEPSAPPQPDAASEAAPPPPNSAPQDVSGPPGAP